MRVHAILLAVASCVLGYHSSFAEGDDYAQRLLSEWAGQQSGFPGAVAASSVGVVAAAAANGGPLPGADTVYEIGSMTKTFTALAAQLLADQGKLSMTSPLREFLPNATLSASVGAITLRELASHTSGLARMPDNHEAPANPEDPMADYQPADLLAYLSGCSLGPKTFSYSNTGFGVLGYVVTLVTGQSFEASIRGLITVPLGMRDTSVQLSSSQAARFAQPYTDGRVSTQTTFTDAMVGAGGLRSTASDMLIYVRASAGLASPDAAVAAAMKKLRAPVAADDFPPNRGQVGGAWQRFTSRGAPVWWKDGATAGYNCMAVLGAEDVVVVLSNVGESRNSPDASVMKLAKRILAGLPPTYNAPAKLPPLSSEMGTYSMPAGPISGAATLQVFKDTTSPWAGYPGSAMLTNSQAPTEALLPIRSACSWSEAYYMPGVTNHPIEVYFVPEGAARTLVLWEYGEDSFAVKMGDVDAAVIV